MQNPDYLRDSHYRDSSRLSARIAFWERFSQGGKDRWPRWAFDHFEIPEVANILEVGSGRGDLWAANADRVPPGSRVTLSDLSAGMLAESQDRLAAALKAMPDAMASTTMRTSSCVNLHGLPGRRMSRAIGSRRPRRGT